MLAVAPAAVKGFSMSDRRPMSVQDSLWLTMDRPNSLMVIDSIMWMEEPDWDKVSEVVQERLLDKFPVFGCRPVGTDEGWAWEPDPDFDLDRHLIRVEYDEPADLDDVRAYCEAQRSVPFDKTHPLWVMHQLGPVQFRNGAVGAVMMTRFHHAIADGIRLTQVLIGMCDMTDAPVASAVTSGIGGSTNPMAHVSKAAKGVGGRAVGAATHTASKALEVAEGTVVAATGTVVAATGTAVGVAKALPSTAAMTAGMARGAAKELPSMAQDAAGAAIGQALRAAADPEATLKALPGQLTSTAASAATTALNTAWSAGQLATGVVGTATGKVTGVAAGLASPAFDLLSDPSQFVDAVKALSEVDQTGINNVASLSKLAFAGRSIDTVWSGTPGIEKTAAWARPMPLDLIKAAGKAEGCTVNDVLIAAVAGALRGYLQHHDAMVDEVVWMIPVSLLPFSADLPKGLGNHFALVALQMPLHIADPKVRLHELARRMRRIKNSHEPVLTFGIQRAISESPSDLGVFLTNFLANKAVGVLTNVPGPRNQMTLAGTPVAGVLGWAPCSGDQPMTICIFSYNGKVNVGFGTDRDLIPDSDLLAQCFTEAVAEIYEATVGPWPQEVAEGRHGSFER